MKKMLFLIFILTLVLSNISGGNKKDSKLDKELLINAMNGNVEEVMKNIENGADINAMDGFQARNDPGLSS
jgi:hypothetical protein